MDTTRDTTAAFQSTDGDELADYRAISLLAVLGLLLGIASPLALVRLVLIVIPALAIFVCIVALRRIDASEGRIFGRRAAWAGLCLAVFFVVAAPAYTATRRQLIAAQARPLAKEFLTRLAQREPQKAIQLTMLPTAREPLDADLWDHFRGSEEARKSITQFVDHPMVGTILALGEEAEIRYFGSGGVQHVAPMADQIPLYYAVTYEIGGTRRSFFVEITLTRLSGDGEKPPRWRVATFEGCVRPDAAS